MRVAFRVDASREIGTGHVMRCLTLADALKLQQVDTCFISRPHDGHLLDYVRERGHQQIALPEITSTPDPASYSLFHERWLGTSWRQDAEDFLSIVNAEPFDLLVLDHYALDHRWEQAVGSAYGSLLVIDDLTDRAHECDYLLNQNFGFKEADYADLTPESCVQLVGPRYALLKPDFAKIRDYSLQRRDGGAVQTILITMGGVDNVNATGAVLSSLEKQGISDVCLKIVMGPYAPHLEDVRRQAGDFPVPAEVLVGVEDMAKLMAESDLAIGAGGATAWERCCLGLPSIVVVVAENQVKLAEVLRDAQASKVIFDINDIASQLPVILDELRDEGALALLSLNSRRIVDGRGVDRVVGVLTQGLSG